MIRSSDDDNDDNDDNEYNDNNNSQHDDDNDYDVMNDDNDNDNFSNNYIRDETSAHGRPRGRVICDSPASDQEVQQLLNSDNNNDHDDADSRVSEWGLVTTAYFNIHCIAFKRELGFEVMLPRGDGGVDDDDDDDNDDGGGDVYSDAEIDDLPSLSGDTHDPGMRDRPNRVSCITERPEPISDKYRSLPASLSPEYEKPPHRLTRKKSWVK
jgi:hypothetical protein